MPAGYDAEVAELFRDLRAATALSEMELAARLGTRADVVQALEQGALYALPPWAETCRVVNAYGALLNLDVRPLLRRIYAQLEAGIVELQPKPMPDVPMMTPPADPQDYSFAPSNAGGSSAPNPLDIPWPPPGQQAPPQRNAWPNGPTAPSPQPQAPGRTRSRSRKRRGRTRNSRNASRKPGPAVSRRPRLRGKIRSRSGKPNLRGSRKASLSGRRSPARHSRSRTASASPAATDAATPGAAARAPPARCRFRGTGST